ncbi:hypothetical protein LEM8419_02944 [Neolewinella maritima]|uniref:DUF3857 domain-containing protein n=1 Tax=Neolewinella maritima TaxID=1383882 RepID=A0ABN8F624_9BACT|nr:DUF3857 domain-containing protein [Neolewinella maritima]CAH1002029.1 hypothetical protein LEM8419_02944 [Neolewinella maritima]
MISCFGKLTWLALLCTTFLSAQATDVVEYGRISDADRALLQAPADSAAEAYVLYDHLDLDFAYRDGEGPSTVETTHRRLKLFKPSAYERANITLSFNREYVEYTDVEGIVHLPQGGSILLTSADIVTQKGEGLTMTTKFTFPRLCPGATIEYRYVKRTKSILTPTVYTFQEDIPVRWAEYTATIPAYYDYVSLGASGRYHINESKIISREWGPSFTTGPYASRNELDHTRIRWVMTDLDAYDYQPYSNNFIDYLPKARLQLRGVWYPGEGKRSIFSTWEETVDELQDRKDFGRYYRNKINYGRLWSAAEANIAAAADLRGKIEAAYRFVVEHYRWNGYFSILATDAPNKTFENGRGNSADLNIALLSLLNEAGIDAHPLLVSLRNGGAPIEAYPMLQQFDHLMVYTEVDGQTVLLDANDADRPVGLPRVAALNHRGWVAEKGNPRWVNIEVPPAKQTVMVSMDVAADGQTTAHLRSRLESYYAFDARSALNDMTNDREAPLASVIIAQYPDAVVLKTTHEGAAKGANSDILSLDVDLQLPAGQAMNDFLYIQPVLLPMLDDQLDDVESRLYPIDFPYPWIQRYVAQINLPEGFVVDELPASLRLKADDGSIAVVYSVDENVALRAVTVNFAVQLDRTLYTSGEYGGLREMFRRIIDLQQAPIVLKRAK